jgi:hypothetical protein
MTIDINDKQSEKLHPPIFVNRDTLSNVIASSCLQLRKHDAPMISTFRGMVIDFNEQFAKQNAPINFKNALLSNVIFLSWQHFSKHNFPRISTFRGMQTDSNRQ